VIKKPQRRRPRPDLGCRAIGWMAGWISLNGIKLLFFAMVKCGVLSEIQTEFLNIIYTRFGFKGSISSVCLHSTECDDVTAQGQVYWRYDWCSRLDKEGLPV
jgi:hypothetical protein